VPAAARRPARPDHSGTSLGAIMNGNGFRIIKVAIDNLNPEEFRLVK
jgi:hypothetical protein